MIKAVDFAKKHNTSRQAVTQAVHMYKKKNNGEYPKWVVKSKKDLFINEKFLEEYRDARKHIWITAHDYYYYLTYVVGLAQLQIAKRIAYETGFKVEALVSYLNNYLFASFNENILSTQFSIYQVVFMKYAERSIPHFHRLGICGNIDGYKERLKDMI